MTKPALADTAELLTPQELADLCRVPLATVYRWNYMRSKPSAEPVDEQNGEGESAQAKSLGQHGPAFIKLGRHVRYSRAEVNRWLAEQAAGSRQTA